MLERIKMTEYIRVNEKVSAKLFILFFRIAHNHKHRISLMSW
jgi:hypothetical protein